ncbi:4-hydroxyphenylpyruvate dioxygenase [Streptomyces mirabilis]|uniref:4-hydroxyphenylpyruvate dioxygenase n=1 Tax=Streptomyces mirabilis TaxID=68239 RepID=UPI001BB0086D|nr:4-hydroxyphenylpyruvate dioxygenase [Streptomyces mirabilis]QUW84577.1 4-hydroxyphenylpyruvate dioxygenase [Streptomyces mirabilis]
MAVSGIAYVELYTLEKKATVDYFQSLFGFTTVAHAVTPEADSSVLRQGDVQLVVTAGPVTRDFLDEHGDGIADIAFLCDDVHATRTAVLAAGGRLVGTLQGHPVLSGFGDCRHTLLPAAPAADDRLPVGRDWATTPTRPARPTGRIRLLDHVAVCLDGGTLVDYADYYQDGFGLDRYSSEYIAVGDQAMDSIVVRSSSGAVTFTLLEPDATKGSGQIDAFLERNSGPGVQHLAFLVDDILPAVREFGGRGVDFLHTPGAYYDMLAERFPDMGGEIAELRTAHVLADRDEWGYLLQLFTRSPFEQNTLFYELIQRRGSRGFGSANIKALYEAVDRDMLGAAE